MSHKCDLIVVVTRSFVRPDLCTPIFLQGKRVETNYVAHCAASILIYATLIFKHLLDAGLEDKTNLSVYEVQPQ